MSCARCQTFWIWGLLLGLGTVGCATGGNRFGSSDAQLAADRTTLSVPENSVEVVSIQYTDRSGRPIRGARLSFLINGEALGASLDLDSTRTGTDGRAELTLRTRQRASFELVIRAQGTDELRIPVEVTQQRLGAFDYVVNYQGQRTLSGIQVGVFINTTCQTILRNTPSPVARQAVSQLGQVGRFPSIELDRGLVIYAIGIGIGGDNVIAEACRDVTLTTEGQRIELNMLEVNYSANGRFRVANEIDLTSGVSAGLDFILEAVSGLSLNTGTYIVNMFFDDPQASREHNIVEGIFRSTIASLLEEILVEVSYGAPDWVQAVRQAGRLVANVNHTLEHAEFRGLLECNSPEASGIARCTDRIDTVRFTSLNGAEDYAMVSTATVDANFGRGVFLPAHEFTGLTMLLAFDNVLRRRVLGSLPGRPITAGEFIRSVAQCADASSYLITTFGGQKNGINDVLLRTVCDVGVTVAAASFETNLRENLAFTRASVEIDADSFDPNNSNFSAGFQGDGLVDWRPAESPFVTHSFVRAERITINGSSDPLATGQHPVLIRLRGR